MDALALDRPIAIPVPASTSTGVVRMYKDTSLISRPVIFLCRYSGVRPTMRPAMNTATIATMRIPYIPVPVPPGATSPSPMLKISRPPPSAVNEEWAASMAPVEVPVVDVANSEEAATPNRVSLPSMAAPASLRAVPGWAASSDQTPARISPHKVPIVARIA